jgi:hypothetical protein
LLNTKGIYAHVEVVATVVDPKEGMNKTTNIFNFKFKGQQEARKILPESYSEGIKYLSARRQHLEDL